ncbi:unnamed protein product [Phytomonas sp. EM1]|nr:unnamed protein product [Phytomonas sp. EM1]|eukprot:CCW62618.1 unnamed protein product [Phytomonas sp. isolate EM1]
MDGGDTQRRMLGYAFVEERLDVIGGFGHFSLVFRFSEEVCNAITTSGRTWPVALKLTGVIGDTRERAARQRTAEASTLLHRWVFPVLLLAGLVGMLWLSAQFIEWKYQTTHAAAANSGAEPECSVGAKKRN